VRVLALDTATEACSVALLTEGGVIERCAEPGRAHADGLLDLVDAVLAEGEVTLAMLDGIAADVGPGAFTGVRLSVAVAQGLAFGAGLPALPVTSLEALALQAMQSGAQRVLVCLDARMGEVYWGCFALDPAYAVAALGELRVGSAAEVRLPGATLGVTPTPATPAGAVRYRGIGRGFAAYPQLATLEGVELEPPDSRALPQAREVARLGSIRLSAGQGIDPAELLPRYVRDKVAWTEAERRDAK
jgi:tRNA threonylcarbamoyladenosine biosynthesis protein TsaB